MLCSFVRLQFAPRLESSATTAATAATATTANPCARLTAALSWTRDARHVLSHIDTTLRLPLMPQVRIKLTRLKPARTTRRSSFR